MENQEVQSSKVAIITIIVAVVMLVGCIIYCVVYSFTHANANQSIVTTNQNKSEPIKADKAESEKSVLDCKEIFKKAKDAFMKEGNLLIETDIYQISDPKAVNSLASNRKCLLAIDNTLKKYALQITDDGKLVSNQVAKENMYYYSSGQIHSATLFSPPSFEEYFGYYPAFYEWAEIYTANFWKKPTQIEKTVINYKEAILIVFKEEVNGNGPTEMKYYFDAKSSMILQINKSYNGFNSTTKVSSNMSLDPMMFNIIETKPDMVNSDKDFEPLTKLRESFESYKKYIE